MPFLDSKKTIIEHLNKIIEDINEENDTNKIQTMLREDIKQINHFLVNKKEEVKRSEQERKAENKRI